MGFISYDKGFFQDLGTHLFELVKENVVDSRNRLIGWGKLSEVTKSKFTFFAILE